ncbi:MAG: heliorhodopsin HeR [Actinobacteria bacterium]|nr:heliorhodopsin HeR [Actinomycetota bacterium]
MKSTADNLKPESTAADLEPRFRNLRWWNIVVGLVLAAQAIIIAALQNGFSIPVVATWLNGPPGTLPEIHKIGSFQLGWGVFAFMLLSALALLLTASPGIFDWYKRNLVKNRNHGRWIEYSITASLMMILITMICGAVDLAAVLAIFSVSACMILFGLLMEKYEQPGNPNWLPYLCGCFAGVVPWIVVLIYVWSPGFGAQSAPNFVYGIIISLFIFFNTFPVNMLLQYKKVGPWRDYLFGEKVYILLSLTAKALLAWQVFGAVLAGTAG